MTSLTHNAAAVEAAMAYNGTPAFGLGGRSILSPADLYRPLGLSAPHHHQQPARAPTTTTTQTSTGTSEFHQHRSPFAIQQLLGLGQDKKPSNDPMLSAHRDDHQPLSVTKSKDYRDYHDRLR